jgi:Holliday junction resolvase RusA-like endonuclease
MPRTRRRKATVEPVELEPAGTVICEGEIPERPVPWKAPTLGANGGAIRNRSYVAYKTWQAVVAAHARVAMGRKRPYAGPVALCLAFHLSKRPGSPPDLSNLVKSTEDALQGVVYRNDTTVRRISAERIVGSTEPDRVRFRVVATD